MKWQQVAASAARRGRLEMATIILSPLVAAHGFGLRRFLFGRRRATAHSGSAASVTIYPIIATWSAKNLRHKDEIWN